MNIGPGDRNVAGAGSPGAFRASDADRERVIDHLKTAFVLGRLTTDELGLRTGRALEARTYVELAAVTAGILAGPTETRLPLPLPPARSPARRPVIKKAVAWSAVAIALSAAAWAAFLTYYGGFLVLMMLAFIFVAVSSAPWPAQYGTNSGAWASNRRK
ncbi:MAG: DUF1707 domain-containing protein [Actinomycetota bacterium]|nr:DUF1707 domain-containing protein [Actinomycetota bacterium]